ncbi:MAG: hypothetical protein RIG62_12050 [Cyclobacteriaceae bacterium]
MHNVKLYQYFFSAQRFTLRRFVQGGFWFGLCFPAGAIILDIILHDFPLNFASVIRVHQVNPIHYVVDTAPWVLSTTAYLIGWMVQCKEEHIRQHIVESETKFYNILQHNPDALFLVRVSDFKIEQYNHMALQLCDIDDPNNLLDHATGFFNNLNQSLSILEKLQQEGDTFSSEMHCATPKGREFWGQVSVHVFTLKAQSYQLIRVADISPAKQRELELQEIKCELEQYSEELQSANEEVTAINNNLEQMVEERTALLQVRNQQLTEYAFLNAHKIRGPLTRVLGAAYALEHVEDESQKQQLIQHVVQSAKELDHVIHRIAKAITVIEDEKDAYPVNLFKEGFIEE